MTSIAYPRNSLRLGLTIQARVIGAIIMRELHTRFGRHNVGYLWLFLEPGLLATGVATTHFFLTSGNRLGMPVVPFYVSGYTAFCAFRWTVNRAGTTVESNRGLMFHRRVTVVDLLFGRALLDAVAALTAGLVLLAATAVLGLGELPGRPLLWLAGWGLNFWFCFSLSMLCCAGCVVWPTLDKFIHPATYLILPLSGVFDVFDQIPPLFRYYVMWVPMGHIYEIIREGVFSNFNSPYPSAGYVVVWCVVMTLFGLLALRVVRPKIEL